MMFMCVLIVVIIDDGVIDDVNDDVVDGEKVNWCENDGVDVDDVEVCEWGVCVMWCVCVGDGCEWE